MKYYCEMENRIITSEEMVRKYGTSKAIPQLCIFELSVQPDYVPVGFNLQPDGTWYPVQSYDEVKANAIAALMATGMTQAEAEAAIA